MINRREFTKAVGAAVGTAALGTGAVAATGSDSDSKWNGRTDGTGDGHFVGAWSAAPAPPAESGLSEEGFENRTVRQMVNPSVGGSVARIRLTNRYGEDPVTFEKVTVADRDGGASVVPGSTETVTFGGEESVFLPAGAAVYSDPVEFDVSADEDVAVSFYAVDATGPATRHPLALKQTYSALGNYTEASDGDAFEEAATSWFFLKGVDVRADEEVGTVVALGDSITDGFASTPGADHRYPDYLARRFVANGVERSVVNAGISGNRVLYDSVSGTGFGNNALARLDHDVLAQPGVTEVILLEGINDIGQYPPAVGADRIIFGLKQIARQLHAHDIDVYAGTLTPTQGASYEEDYDSAEAEAQRQAVNEFIRTTDAFDGVVDFDAALRDPDHPERMLPKYDSGDNLHPGDAGYRAMAEAVDLSLFEDGGKGESGREGEAEDGTESEESDGTTASETESNRNSMSTRTAPPAE
ncbi:SGNH/GDSL hydrolase family protein [Halogeometricum sp. S1BR25-6]|uniref:SGNH/GDSL hydrolase family protein n=1 Tax=Halogeometricum salsisoli TaxID=2950536 RepID=A0ABU2G9Z6_9EURY|nr:SGNH/GDSL hydrolase family protein [Halogeometricum sp. S1BR25-6]MDS0297124.1 SGNH/GDSL hydrolase family protein [Halogeometricum sp. S1BR25-6]